MGKTIAIIPARSGSKRIPKKNIVDLAGKPMIAWTIEAALGSEIFSEVIVYTDSDEIAEISKSYGATVPFIRERADADDFTPISQATVNALEKMEILRSEQYEEVVQLMPNCPCRTAEDIKNANELFRRLGAQSMISMFQFGWMNPWWAMKINEATMSPDPLFPEAIKKRSQDLEKLFCPTGAIWIAKTKKLKVEKTFYGQEYAAFPIEWQSAVDIDDYEDLKMAEMVLLGRGKDINQRGNI